MTATEPRSGVQCAAANTQAHATRPNDACASSDAAEQRGEQTDPVIYNVSVRNLCAFAAKSGDLDFRFTPSPTAQQGRQGHQIVAQRRGPDHESEVSLSGRYRGLLVRGRADGYDPRSATLEEVKTFRGAVEAIAPQQKELHWAQLKVYGAMLCESRGLTALSLSLVYFDVQEQTEIPFTQQHSALDLRLFFDRLCKPFLQWATSEQAHRRERDRALAQLMFPQLPFRPGQRELAAAVYRACVQSHTLMAQAPTGIGKTMGTLFPALRAMPQRATDKLFYLTARTPGRQLALDALQQLRAAATSDARIGGDQSSAGPPQGGLHPLGGPGAAWVGGHPLPLRVIELVAKEKSCEHPDKSCHGASCPLARGFYDRLSLAREEAAQQGWLDQQGLRRVALAHGICPYYLGHEMVRWSDVVVADYNYYFDRSAMLYALTLEGGWRITVLVDEAHNLVPRGCAMYSAELSHAETAAVRAHAPPALRARIDALLDQWQILSTRHAPLAVPQDWHLLPEPPETWLRALHKLNLALGEHVNTTAQDSRGPLLPFYFRTLALAMLADAYGEHSLCELDLAESVSATDRVDAALARQVVIEGDGFDGHGTVAGCLRLRNIVPGHFLLSRYLAADALVLFSATLHPGDYFQSLLSLPDTTVLLDLPSPFRSEQLHVRVVPVSTRRDARASSLGALVSAMAQQYRKAPGNYLAFFSSFDYLEQASARLQAMHPDIAVWSQARQMSEPARRSFLQQFDQAGQGIGFAVLGGVFGEGVDLPGRRLIGAFVATMGLPQFDPVNEAIRARMQERFGRGYDYTYVYPGLQKVVQAAGRVIRSESDTGCVLLLDERYREARYRALLPSWWRITPP